MVSNGSMHDDDDDDDLLLSDDAEDSSESGKGCFKSHCMPATRRTTSATIRLHERVRRTASAATTARKPIAEGGRHGAAAKSGGDGAAAPTSDREPLVALGKRRKSGRSATLMRRIIRSVRKSEYTVDLEEDNDGDAAELRGCGGAARGGKQRRFHLSPSWRPLFVVVWAVVTLAVATGVFVATYNTFEHERQEEVEMECEAWRVLLEEHFTDTTNQIRLLANLVSTFHFRKPKGTLDRRTFLSFLNETTDGAGCAPQSTEYAPIIYTTSAQLPAGQDLMWSADATGLSAVEHARDNGTMGALTAPLRNANPDATADEVAAAAAAEEAVERENHWVEAWGAAADGTALLRVYPVYKEGRAPPGEERANVTAMRNACRGYMSALVDFTSLRLERDFLRMQLLKNKMKAARNVAERASVAKGTFLATMSHELRTPMNGVIGMLNLLLETPLSITQLDYVETAHTSGRALLELINDILDLSKIEANKMPLESVPMDVRAQVGTVLTMFVERFPISPSLPSSPTPPSPTLSLLPHLPSPSAPASPPPLPAGEQDAAGERPHGRASTGGHGADHVRGALPRQAAARGGRVHRPLGAARCARRLPALPPGALLGWVGCNSWDVLAARRQRWREGGAEGECGASEEGTGEGRQGGKGKEECAVKECVIDVGGDGTAAAAAGAGSGDGESALRGPTVRLVISVEDTGEGIPKAAQKTILKPFTQADASTTRTHGGTGIGLSISRHLVALMGGKLAFSSRPGVGTTFYFDILVPLVVDHTQQQQPLQLELHGAQPMGVVGPMDASTSPRLSSPFPARVSTSLNTSPRLLPPSSTSPVTPSSARHYRNPSLQLLQVPRKELQGMQAAQLRLLQSTPVHRLTASPIHLVPMSPLPLLQRAEASLTHFDALLLDDKPVRFGVTESLLARLGIPVRNVPLPRDLQSLFSSASSTHAPVSQLQGLRPVIVVVEGEWLERLMQARQAREEGGRSADEDSGGRDSPCTPRMGVPLQQQQQRERREGEGGSSRGVLSWQQVAARLNGADGGRAGSRAAAEEGGAPFHGKVCKPVRFSALSACLSQLLLGAAANQDSGNGEEEGEEGDEGEDEEGTGFAVTRQGVKGGSCSSAGDDGDGDSAGRSTEQQRSKSSPHGEQGRKAEAGSEGGAIGLSGKQAAGGSAVGRGSVAVKKGKQSKTAQLLCEKLGGRRILVVDDNMVNRKVMSKMLERYDVHVEAVDGGAKAIAAVARTDAAATPYDCVFMDLQMPGMDGLEATGLIRKYEVEQQAKAAASQEDAAAAGAKRRLLVIALTADVGAGTKEKCVGAGMDGYMTKPIEEDQLSRTLLPFFDALQ
ncbi:unnamed protein product [Closterium sp. Yama58-4]|nr:unnamed protein product [Closterium sp. Yama58-4]